MPCTSCRHFDAPSSSCWRYPPIVSVVAMPVQAPPAQRLAGGPGVSLQPIPFMSLPQIEYPDQFECGEYAPERSILAS